MDRHTFRRIWSISAWILLIVSWIVDFTIYGIDPFFIVLAMWILGGFVTRAIYGKADPQPQENQIPTYEPSSQNQFIPDSKDHADGLYGCPNCGEMVSSGDRFCQICGTRLELSH